MEYIINTTFLGEDISYDLMEGKFDFQKDDNPIRLVDSFQLLVKQENILKKHNDFMCITISTTDACNLNCLYCFEKHGKTLLKKEYILDICKLIAEYKKISLMLHILWLFGLEENHYLI